MPTLMCVDGHRDIPRGASAYLLLTGWASGLIARGSLVCAPFLAARLDRPGTVGQHVLVRWTEVLGLGDRIPLEILQAELPEAGWLALTGEASAMSLTARLTELVHRLWRVWTDPDVSGVESSWALSRSDVSE